MPSTVRSAATKNAAEDRWRSVFLENCPANLPPDLLDRIGSGLALDSHIRLALTSRDRFLRMASALERGTPGASVGSRKVQAWLPPLGTSLAARLSHGAFRWSYEIGPLMQRMPVVLRPIKSWGTTFVNVATALRVARSSAPHLMEQLRLDWLCGVRYRWIFTAMAGMHALDFISGAALIYAHRQRNRILIGEERRDDSVDDGATAAAGGKRSGCPAARRLGLAAADFFEWQALSRSIDDGNLPDLRLSLMRGARIGRSALWNGSALERVDHACREEEAGAGAWRARLFGDVADMTLSSALPVIYTAFYRRSAALVTKKMWDDLRELDHSTELASGHMHPVLSAVINTPQFYAPPANSVEQRLERHGGGALARRAVAGPQLNVIDALALSRFAPGTPS